MSRLDFCKYELVGDCYDWKNDNCDECNIFKAYCEGARRAKNSIVRCKDCKHHEKFLFDDSKLLCWVHDIDIVVSPTDYCSYAERRAESEVKE